MAMLDLFCIGYNFIRVYRGIKTTPAERTGILLNLKKNKWVVDRINRLRRENE